MVQNQYFSVLLQQNNKNKMANEEDYFIAANSVGAINEEQYNLNISY